MKHTKYWSYLKWSARIFWGGFILFVVTINLTGCKPTTTCQNTTINNTIYKITYNTTIKEVFIDVPGNCSNETVFISSTDNLCDISLINQIKILERTIDKWAIADINITINETNSTNTTGGNST